MDIHKSTHTGAGVTKQPAPLDLSPVQSILIDTVLVPAITNKKLKFRQIPSPNVRSDASLLFYKAVEASDLPQKLETTTNRTVKLLNFDYCYEQALTHYLHDFLFNHFQQAIRLDPELIRRHNAENQARIHLILVSTRWYVNLMGDGRYVMDCLHDVQAIFHEAQDEYERREIRH